MREKFNVEVNDQAFYGQESTSVTTFLTDNEQACNSLRVHEGAAARFLRKGMSGSGLAAVKSRLNLLLHDASRHKRAILIYDGMVNYLLL